MSREPERRVSSCQSLRSSAAERGPEAEPGPGRWVSRWTGSGTTACRLAAEWWGIQVGLSETWRSGSGDSGHRRCVQGVSLSGQMMKWPPNGIWFELIRATAVAIRCRPALTCIWCKRNSSLVLSRVESRAGVAVLQAVSGDAGFPASWLCEA